MLLCFAEEWSEAVSELPQANHVGPIRDDEKEVS
jgi:hypothetical protein